MTNENGGNAEDSQYRISLAQWVLERQLSWIAAAEVKVGVIVAIDTALLGGLAAAFSSSESAARTSWAYLFALGTAGAAVIAILCCAMAVLPRIKGPTHSLMYFVPIAAQDTETYDALFRQAKDEQLLSDWVAQIHRNAQIACEKYVWVRRGMIWSFLAAATWICAVGLLVKL